MEQPGGMISEECMEQGCALMCVAFPQSDCKISLIEEVGAGGMVGGCVGGRVGRWALLGAGWGALASAAALSGWGAWQQCGGVCDSMAGQRANQPGQCNLLTHADSCCATLHCRGSLWTLS